MFKKYKKRQFEKEKKRPRPKPKKQTYSTKIYSSKVLLLRCEASFNKKTILDNFIYKMRFERKDFR